MKYILLKLTKPDTSNARQQSDYDVIRFALEKLEMPSPQDVQLSQCVWLLQRDTAMPFVIEVAVNAGSRQLEVETRFLQDD